MRFQPLRLEGLWLVRPERLGDDRGYFARTYCEDAFAAHGLPVHFPQCNASFNARAGTLRGLHWQDDPHAEGKLVRCVRGAVLDVVVDIRPGSRTRGQWLSASLTAGNGDALFIPPGFAHGFQTLEDGTEIFYQMTERYRDDLARGLRWNDPALAIDWPLPDPVVSARDAQLPLFQPGSPAS